MSAVGRVRALVRRRFTFLFTLMASLTGIASALTIAVDNPVDQDLVLLLNFLGAVTILASWLLLHAGYGRFYGALYYKAGCQGLEFPRTSRPGRVDLMYFAITLGTSFATSDVNVTNREMRWHVLVHSVVGFFYNAIVVAFAIGIITGK